MCVLLTAIKKNHGEWMEGWVDGWMGVKAFLSIAYNNQKLCLGLRNAPFLSS